MDKAPTAKSLGIKKPGVFVPVVLHATMPTPFPMAGAANETFEAAKDRALVALANPAFTRAWVVSADATVEVTR